MDEPSRIDYPMLEIVQIGPDASFRVDLQVGTGIQPFHFSARFKPQDDGTIHVILDQPDSSGRPAEFSGPPIVLRPVDSKPSDPTKQPTGAPSGAGG